MAMASSSSPNSWVRFLTIAAVVVVHVAASSFSNIHMATSSTSLPSSIYNTDNSSSNSNCYEAIYSFGDSFADTGNVYCYDAIHSQYPPSLNPPYGDTYFHHPTGRGSDGRLVIDFFAQQMGIPLLKPYMRIKNGEIQDWNPQEGVNFAVGGATALESSFFHSKAIVTPTNNSLRVQLDWFKELLPSICNSSSSSSSGCKEVLGRSLFFVGEIGYNDFYLSFIQYKSVEEIRTYVSHVINEISSTINNLIDLGAKTLVVPGNFPIGCIFKYLTMFPSTDMEEYDEGGCLKWLNKFAEYYNKHLYAEINQLQVLHPRINIIYADYYHAALRLYQSPRKFGFKETVQNACCDNNNVSSAVISCGKAGVVACDDPSQYISWDGLHFTEAAYKWIAQGLLHGPYTYPKIINVVSCDSDI